MDSRSCIYALSQGAFSKLGRRLKVVALIDPAIDRAAAVLQKKCDSFVVSAYQDTRVYKTLDDFVKNMTPKERPRAIIIGSPPMFRGSLQPGRDVEVQILRHFPGVAMFIEKPIATGPYEYAKDGYEIAKMITETKTICSVGYTMSLHCHPKAYTKSQIHAALPQSRSVYETSH